MARRRHVKVKTADYLKHPDMVRYISYRGVDTTPEPVVVDWHGSRCTVHRFEEGEYTYLRQPSQYNTAWGEQAVARYRSFGVRAEIVLR